MGLEGSDEMRRLTLLLIYFAAAFAPFATADQTAALAALRAACSDDAQRLCAGVSAGGGRILACLKEHKSELSDRCKQAASQAAGAGDNSSSAMPGVTAVPATQASGTTSSSAATSTASTAAKTSPAPPAARAQSGSPAKNAPTGSYLRLQQVQITDPGMDKVQTAQPAFDLLIPSDWTLKGNVLFGGGKGGCFSDIFAVYWDAANADGSVGFQGAPDYSWQYADDPAVMNKLTDPNRRALGGNGKPCPVAKPMKAEEYIRQYVPTVLAGGSTIISVEPFPELNQIARKRMGLPADNGNDGRGTQTDAVRARIEFQKDGKAQESWLAVAVVTRTYGAGRGTFYDCHAIDLTALHAPKGKLDANDKLFKAMISSIRPEPKWQSYSNGIIAKLYNAEAQKEAVQDQAIADFQRHVADTVNSVTANQMRGANNSAFGADQNIRGVQTFRDPTTGSTMELSNLYDHAWLNGSNEYIMSDDPNFNPNGQLTGNWNQLQSVRPAP
jgi:hypothetical protein